MNFCSSGSS
ncbi:hypothetical protein YPPY06_3640, partial [Yersinia pestis PY-06]